MSTDRAALERLLGGPGMAWFLQRVRGRILAAGGEPLRGHVRLNTPSEAQRTAARQLIGRPPRQGSSLSIDLAAVEEVLRRGPWPAGLAHAVQTLTGPVIDHAARREADARAWDEARDLLLPALARFGAAPDRWESWCAGGGLKRATTAEAARLGEPSAPTLGARLVTLLAGILEELPADDEPLAVLARRTTGDAHGLDASRPLGRLAVTVLREVAPAGPPGDGPAASAREVWASAGVIVSTVASTVLCLGVRGMVGKAPAADLPERGLATATALEAMRGACMPVVLTLDQVRSGGIRPVHRNTLLPGGGIYVCENPTIVEVTAQYWAEAPPTPGGEDSAGWVLVCTWGQPGAAVVELLRLLASDGAPVYYHGDFDWPGLRIAESLRAEVPWLPWRFTAADYLEALDTRALAAEPLPLRGRPAPSPWDPQLAGAMAERNVALEEEAVADILAADLIDHRTPFIRQ